ncbi:MAG TPA: hypothetical protein VFU23_07165 [Gemmatimonadales bacterium]|nr:hypothetical protein [Gemmatimonadales bacterium]
MVSEPDRTWFQPGLDRLASLGTDPDPGIRAFFSPDQPVFLARAPGRLDVMGGIADYSGARVLELPLDRSASVMVQRQSAPRCSLATRRAGRWDHFSVELDGLLSVEAGHWAGYLLGAVHVCLRDRRGAPGAHPGFRLLVDSSVPEGKGVASSAALEVAAMSALVGCCGLTMSPERLAAECQWVENHVVGAPCGIMDQMTSACGRENRLLQLRCQPGTIEGYARVPKGLRFFGIDSGIRHDISAADYATVRTAAFMGYRIIAEAAGLTVAGDGTGLHIEDPRWRGYLANIAPEEFRNRFEDLLPETMPGADFLRRCGGITDSMTRVLPDRSYPVRSATAHPIGEQARVTRFAELLADLEGQPGHAAELGALMDASHRSYGRCGLGSSGTDRLVELVAGMGPARGLYGAKITGGGSGGTVAILGRTDALNAVEEIAARYTGETGRAAELFVRSGPGAAETGVMTVG